jgi:glutamine synthetase
VFNGDNYSEEWAAEAAARGLLNHKSTIDALPALMYPETIAVFDKHGVLTPNEVRSRYEIRMEGYAKTINIEALTMIDIVKSAILPSCFDYQNDLVKLLERKRALSGFDTSAEEGLLGKIAELCGSLVRKLDALESALAKVTNFAGDARTLATFYHDGVFAAMYELREVADELETLVAKKHRALPSYGDVLYSVV